MDWQPIETAPSGQRVFLWDESCGLATCGRVYFDRNGGYEVCTNETFAFAATHWALIVGPRTRSIG